MSNGRGSLNVFFSKNIFIGSYYDFKDIPNSNLPECCFLGRSNVGKSSIINAITKTKNLASVSKKPGRTRSINLFEINNKINIIDLPGYGYSKVSLHMREQLYNLVNTYIHKRKNLKKIYLLIDSVVGIKNTDIDAIDIVSTSNINFSIVLTKIDKLAINFVNNQKKSIFSLMKNYPKNRQ